jgi:hypothetical protein
VPAGAVCALLNWPPPAEDDPVPPPVMDALCAALLAEAAGGGLAFRWHDRQALPNGALVYHRMPRRTLADWLGGWMTPARFGVITTGAATVAPALFFWTGWDHGAQAVLAHGGGDGDEARAVATLRQGREWRTAPLPAGSRLLLIGGHDGAFGLVAAADAETLHRFCAAAGATCEGETA